MQALGKVGVNVNRADHAQRENRGLTHFRMLRMKQTLQSPRVIPRFHRSFVFQQGFMKLSRPFRGFFLEAVFRQQLIILQNQWLYHDVTHQKNDNELNVVGGPSPPSYAL